MEKRFERIKPGYESASRPEVGDNDPTFIIGKANFSIDTRLTFHYDNSLKTEEGPDLEVQVLLGDLFEYDTD